MLLEIDDNKTVFEVADKFNEAFPYLKIEFYRHVHKRHVPKDRINDSEILGNIRKNHDSGLLVIRAHDKINKLKRDFAEKFGLHVDFQRVHDKQWIAIHDDNISIEEISDLSELSVESNSKIINSIDDDEVYYGQ